MKIQDRSEPFGPSSGGVRHLYIHVPFCTTRCAYCDFYSETGRLQMSGEYVRSLLAELDDFLGSGAVKSDEEPREGRPWLESLQTIYIGGGTPTLLGADLIERLLRSISEGAPVSEAAEITIEANPATVTRELAQRLRSAGITRVSLGAQTFDEGLRRNLGRIGETESVAASVGFLRKAGFENLSIDLIFGIPGQTLAHLDLDIDRALALGVEHISCYELTVKPDSRFERTWRDQLRLMQESGAGRALYERAVERLEAAGFTWYETSNFALPGRECIHNIAYWQHRDYIGLGAGAWSTSGRDRWRNVEDIRSYIAAFTAVETHYDLMPRSREHLSARQVASEVLMLGLRQSDGVARRLIEGTVDSEQEKLLQDNGFVTNIGDKMCLTRAGRFVANDICARLLAI